MKIKTLIFPVAIATLMVGIFFTSCETASQSEEAAEAQVQEAQEELNDAKQDATFASQRAASAEEWRAFKAEIEEKIAKNENRIAELKIQLKEPGKTLDEAYAKSIDALELQNKDLRTRIANYESDQNDWESFKREFNHDMDALGKALSDLAVDNKN